MKNEKLVRDAIPTYSKIKKDGGVFRVAQDHEKAMFLRRKLVEETNEVCAELRIDPINKSNLVEELGDVLEVVEAVCDHYGIAEDELLIRKAAKTERKGGFGEWAIWDMDTRGKEYPSTGPETLEQWAHNNAKRLTESIEIHLEEMGDLKGEALEGTLRCILTSIREWHRFGDA